MTAQHDESDWVHGCRGVPGMDNEDLERVSVADLLADLAQIEEAIRAAAEAGYPMTAGLARRENAIVEALRRRGAACGDA
ncbi:hypothetical protein [Sinomonas sp. RB5]